MHRSCDMIELGGFMKSSRSLGRRSFAYVFALTLLISFSEAHAGISRSAWKAFLTEEINKAGEAFVDSQREETQRLEGDWKGAQEWSGKLCRSYYRYNVQMKGDIERLEFDLDEAGGLAMTGELRRIDGYGNGAYRSDYTACIPFKGGSKLQSDWAKVKAKVTFGGTGETLNDIQIRVLSTEMGHIHLGKAFPAWFERLFTSTVNKALGKLWASKLGDWVNAKITQYVKEKIPKMTQK